MSKNASRAVRIGSLVLAVAGGSWMASQVLAVLVVVRTLGIVIDFTLG